MDVEEWVEQRLSTLQIPREWRPDAANALGRLRDRDRVYRARRRRLTWIAVAACFASVSILAMPGRCDTPGANSCGQPLAGRLWNDVFRKPAPAASSAEVRSAPVSAPPAQAPVRIAQAQMPAHAPAPTAAAVRFKETGDPAARIACEVYTDYECPACAALYSAIIPKLVTEYVQTGKVRLVHRDFPLPQHPYAALAARYANAAGRLGYYDVAVNRLFQTQDLWAADGAIDAQLTPVLPPGVMQKVRELVRNDQLLGEDITADLEMAKRDEIGRTPTIIVVSHGKRTPLAGVPKWNLLKTYLDGLLAK